MSHFTSALKEENEVIELGLDLLKAYQADFEKGYKLDAENLRTAAFAMHRMLEHCHLRKEKSLLLPALVSAQKNSPENTSSLDLAALCEESSLDLGLLELRMAIDAFEQNPLKIAFLYCALSECITHIVKQLKNDFVLFQMAERFLTREQQNSLYQEAKNFEQVRGRDDKQTSRQIFNRLRLAKGMAVA